MTIHKQRAQMGKYVERLIHRSLKAYIEKHRGYVHRFFDTKNYYAVHPNIIAPQQPSDFMVIFEKNIVFIEVKSSMAQRFPIKNIKSHQLAFAEILESVDKPYWFIIGHRKKKGARYSFYALRYSQLRKLIQKARNEKLKSISWSDIMQNSVALKRKEGLIDLRPILLRWSN